MVQQITQPDTPITFCHAPTEHAVKELVAICSCDLQTVEPVDFAKPHIFVHILHFGAHDFECFVEVEGQIRVKLWRWFDVIDAFPAVHDGEFSPFCRQYWCQRRCLGWTTRWAMFVRKVKPKLVLVVLNGFKGCHFDICMSGEATRIETPSVITRLAMNNLLRQKPAMPTAFAQPGPQSNDAERVALAGDGAD